MCSPLIMNYNTEILSLWIGPESQQAAHHFYSLQAEQFFQDNEDPTNHQSLWAIDAKSTQKFPKMMVFDTKSDHLTNIRQVNHARMLKKMKETTSQQAHFDFFAPPTEEEPVQENQQTQLFHNWTGKEDHYVLIDKKFNEESDKFDFWENMYKVDQDRYEDRIRKRLEVLDFLHVLNFCSDGPRVGFTSQLLMHFQDQCPKKTIIFANLSQSNSDNYVSEICLPLLSEIAPEVTILLDVDTRPLHHPYFQANFYHHFSPLYNCLLTPFFLKNSSCHDYISQISSGRRSLFDVAFTLPIINEENSISKATNIFDYLPNQKSFNMDEEINHVNYANRSFLDLYQFTPSGKEEAKQHQKHWNSGIAEKVVYSSDRVLSESFVLKGHFDEISKLCNQRSQHFDIKYLQGIIQTNPLYQLKYTEFYKKPYGQNVQVYPMHSVLYQHNAFGPSIRNYLKPRTNNIKNQLYNQWKEHALNLSDLYGEQVDVDSD